MSTCFVTYPGESHKLQAISILVSGKEGLVCHDQCSSEGCWGPGADQCLSCINFKLGNSCLQNCSAVAG